MITARPLPVTAIQYTGHNQVDVCIFAGYDKSDALGHMKVQVNGYMTDVYVSNYVVKNHKGELSVMTDSMFSENYEVVQ